MDFQDIRNAVIKLKQHSKPVIDGNYWFLVCGRCGKWDCSIHPFRQDAN